MSPGQLARGRSCGALQQNSEGDGAGLARGWLGGVGRRVECGIGTGLDVRLVLVEWRGAGVVPMAAGTGSPVVGSDVEKVQAPSLR